MSILWGIASLILSILLPVSILIFTDFEVMHFSLFFIIPVGAMAIGYVCGYGYYKGLVKSNVYISAKHFIIGVVLSLICVFGIEYTSYFFTCIDPQTNDIVYTLDGDHISNYEIDGYGQMDFLTYSKFRIENTPISFSYKSQSLGEVSNPIAGWIFAAIDFLGVMLGVLIVAANEKSHPYCHTCQLYKTEQNLFKIPKDDGVNFFEELENSLTKTDMGESTNALLNRFKMDKSMKNVEHYLCKIIYCESCQTASLSLELYEFNSRKQLDKNSNFNYAVDIHYNLAKRTLNQTTVA